MPLTKTSMPPAGPDGCESTVEMLCLHCWKGKLLSLATMPCAPWIFSPSKVSMDWSWYRPSRFTLAVSNVV